MAYPDMTPGPPPPAPPPAPTSDTGSTGTGSFDVEGAKKAGYSDAEIADHLAADAKFDAAAARKSGYSDKELISHLTTPRPTGLEGSPEESFQAGYAQRFPQPPPRSTAPPAPLPGGPPATGGIGDPGTLTGAVAEGWRDAPSFWTSPQARQGAANVPVVGPLYAAGGDLVSGLFGAGNALFRGVQHTAADVAEQVGNAVPEIRIPGYGPISGTVAGGPGLGRDIAAMPEAFPTGVPEEATYSGRGSTLLNPRNGLMPPERPQFVVERTAPPRPPGMTDAERIQQLVEHSVNQEQPTVGPPMARGPLTGEGAPSTPFRPNVDPTKPFTYNPPSSGWPAGAESWTEGQQPQAQPPTTVWRSADHDFPVEPTGVTQAAQDGRIYAQVRQPDGTLSYVPHDELVTTQPAGAQVTPAAQSALTPEQGAAAGSTADKQWYYKTIIPGEANRIQYIKGINPTMAQQELTTNAARDSKLLRRISEDADQNERNLLGRHSEIRKGEFQDIAGSDTTQETALDNANKQIEAQLQAAYANGGTVDLQPVIDAAKSELTGSAGKLPPVKAAMKEIQDAAQKSDGSGLETDPRQANAVRRAIIYMQSKKGQLEHPGYGDPDVMAALTRVKDVLTKRIEPAAPGFTAANANYAKARQAIDAREALQAYEPKLYTGPLGNMTFAPMHRLMGDVIAGRDPRASPINPYKALTEEQMNRLKSLHDDLQRVASAEELARAAGSDTSTTLFDMAKKAVKGGLSTLGGAGVGMLVGHVWPEAAVSAGMFTKSALDSMFSQRAVRQATAEHNQLLQPNLTQYPLRPNPMMNPPP